MYTVGERSQELDALLERIRQLNTHLLSDDLPEPAEILTIHPDSPDLYKEHGFNAIYIVRSGVLMGTWEDRTVLCFETGDLAGLCNSYQLPALTLKTEGPVELARYDASELLRFVTGTRERESIWTSYLLTLVSLLTVSLARSQHRHTQLHTGYLHYQPGDVIIQEGDSATEVYTIMNGQADVYVDGVRVGEILKDEIFGAMAVFSGMKRTATVVAVEECTVLAVPRNEFVTLIQTHPETTMTLIENMARCITSLNEKLAAEDKNDPADERPIF